MNWDLLLDANHLPRTSDFPLHEGENQQEVGWWFALRPCNDKVL